jgi:hypothetical protein
VGEKACLEHNVVPWRCEFTFTGQWIVAGEQEDASGRFARCVFDLLDYCASLDEINPPVEDSGTNTLLDEPLNVECGASRRAAVTEKDIASFPDSRQERIKGIGELRGVRPTCIGPQRERGD